MWRSRIGLVAALFVILILSSCGRIIGTGEQIVCPNVAVLRDAASITQFKPGQGRDLIDVQFEGQIGEVGAACSYNDDTIRMELNLQILASRGPAAKINTAEFIYFIAVVGDGGVILVKSTFGSQFEFRPNVYKAAVLEQLSPTIPIKPGTSTFDYRVLIGFQLSADELKYNRSKLDY